MAQINLAEEQRIREDLQSSLPKGLVVDMETMFPKLTGFGVAKKNQKRLELIRQHAQLLTQILEEGETLRMMSPGIVNMSWETLMMGVWAQLINRTVLVLSDRRLLLIHLNGKKAESFINQVPLEAVKKFSKGFLGSSFTLGNGSISLSGMPKVEAAKFAALLPKNKSAQGGLQHLCPKCFAPYTEHRLRCSQCQADFKSPKTAALRSLILPGLGDYYLGHKALGGLEMMGSFLTWIVAISLIAGGIEEGEPLIGVGFGVFIIATANGFDALLTRAQAKKGLLAIDGKLGG